jgi:hypothetical protein
MNMIGLISMASFRTGVGSDGDRKLSRSRSVNGERSAPNVDGPASAGAQWGPLDEARSLQCKLYGPLARTVNV